MSEEAQKKRLLADIGRFQPDYLLQTRSLPPLGRRLTLWAVGAFVLLLLCWAALGRVDRVVVGEGKVVTVSQPVVLQAYTVSLIREIRTTMGERVRKGDILVVLDPTFAAADMARLQERIASLTEHEARLRCELDDMPYPQVTALTPSQSREQRIQADIRASRRAEYAARLRTYDEQRARVETEIDATVEDVERREERLSIYEEFEDMRRRLYQAGVEARAGFLEVQKDRLSVEADLLRLKSSITELRHDLDRIAAGRAAYVTGWRSETAQELVSVRRQLDEAREQQNKALRMGELVDIRAPMDAVVLDVARRNAGSVADEAEALVTLVPVDAALEVEVDIAAEDVGYIEEGMPAAVKLLTLPYQRHGKMDGVLKAISRDSFDKETAQGVRRVFRARISLPAAPLSTLRNLPDGFALLPGLALTAEISAGTRSIIEYVLYPILAGFDAGLREPR